MMRLPIDRFTGILIIVIGIASWIPAQGMLADVLSVAGGIAVALLFFFHGAALSREQVVAGASHWRLHIIIIAMTFLVFPLLVWPISRLPSGWIPNDLVLGFLYLGVLPSAVSSSIAFTAMARGNVPAAVCSAAASNVFGMMLTPFLLMLLVSAAGDGFSIGEALKGIMLQLLLPFGLGHMLRPWIGDFMERHKSLMTRYDQGVILLIVYSAFSQSVVSGLWQKLPMPSILLAVVLCIGLLFVVILIARLAAGAWGLKIEDEAAVVFCGSKKSLASGLPMAKVLFVGHPGFGMIILPIMCYNQLQIVVGAVMAKWYLGKVEKVSN